MKKLTANLLRATRLTMIAAAGSLSLHAGLAHAAPATETYTFTADGLFSTDVTAFSFGVGGTPPRIDDLHLTLPINKSTPEFLKLAATEKTFDATLVASSPTQFLTYDFTGALVTGLTLSSDSRIAAVDLGFATETFSQRPPAMAAPEIDPASAVSGVFLLAGGLAVLRGRRTVAVEPTAAA